MDTKLYEDDEATVDLIDGNILGEFVGEDLGTTAGKIDTIVLGEHKGTTL